jgi:hypothetical protein
MGEHDLWIVCDECKAARRPAEGHTLCLAGLVGAKVYVPTKEDRKRLADLASGHDG